MNSRRTGFNIFGYVTGEFGQAQATRHTLRMMLHRGYPVIYRDMSRYDGRATADAPYPERAAARFAGLPYAINMFHANPPECALRMHIQWSHLRIEKRFNAMVPFWELPILPRTWKHGLRMMDMVLAPSLFVKETLERELPDVPIIHFPQAVSLPVDIKPDRARWKLPADHVVFLCSFDVTSDVERKNPWAAIRAYTQAFSPDDPSTLVIKINARHVRSEQRGPLAELARLAVRRNDLVVIDGDLPFRDLLTLYASCDVVVSLHRAEGLGLVLLEAMTLGKPVISTAWSGNMDFTTSANSCLVPYELVPVEATHPAYDRSLFDEGPLWAEPDSAAAAAAMRELADHEDVRHTMGTTAAADMTARRQEHLRAGAIDALLRFYENRGEWLPRHTQIAPDIRRHRRLGWLSLVSRAPGYAARRTARILAPKRGLPR